MARTLVGMWEQNEHDWYVDKVDWLVHTGRDDLIDEIADEYERRLSADRARREERPPLRLAG